MASHELDSIISSFEVHQPSEVCKTPTTISLFLLSLWVPPAVCSLICGSSLFRRRLSRIKKQPEDNVESINRFYLFASLFGSFFFQLVVWTTVQGQLLSDDDPDNELSNTYWVWLIRPLPTTFVFFMAYLCPTLYLENALEMQFVEGVMGLFTIDIYDDIRKAVSGLGDLSTEQAGDGNTPALQHISSGAKLGFAFWILSFFVALAVVVLLVVGMMREKPLDSTPLRIWTCWSIIFNAMRMIAGWLIWTEVAQLHEQIFCPSLTATGAIAAIAFASTMVDHGWRAYFCVEDARFNSLSSVFRATLLRSYRKAPTDEETREVAVQNTESRSSLESDSD
ncbi:hypothetical protein H2200_012532 [Cladophialophora chaetospira]|uniref:Transmembrane protein n=1 Tax=Cladophialophora chaetospira TaxID=386627 RepID=A0AA39CC17_9EURO|nr:hypothetical protein H2200_012532 [Cladophialophora chaetospira]